MENVNCPTAFVTGYYLKCLYKGGLFPDDCTIAIRTLYQSGLMGSTPRNEAGHFYSQLFVDKKDVIEEKMVIDKIAFDWGLKGIEGVYTVKDLLNVKYGLVKLISITSKKQLLLKKGITKIATVSINGKGISEWAEPPKFVVLLEDIVGVKE